VNILDLGAYFAGPFASRLLADMGADVIKVETVVGDQLRGIERPFFGAQAGKRSLAANMKDQQLKRAVTALIEWADVFHHNMRPGAAERLGFGIDQVRSINPDLIYLYAPGWGSGGPFALRQSFAPMLSGYVGISSEVAGNYNEPMPSLGNEDPGNGLMGAVALLISLAHRRLRGGALYSENPQLHAAMGLMAHIVRSVGGEAIGAGRLDVFQMGVDALESLYETKDGWLLLVARTDAEIAATERVIGLSILADSRFGTYADRQGNRDELADLLRDQFAGRATADWLAAFQGSGVVLVEPAGPSAMHDVFHEAAQRTIGRVAEVRHAERGLVREFARFLRISDAAVPPHRAAPCLGEHSAEVLAMVGYTPGEIDALRTAGSIR
jgi:crotonobetainyl-CoA:carnitine CoA-transferase CaiB-like acyl-CoA transferase